MYISSFAEVGNNIKRKIDSSGMSQQNLADKMNVSRQVINKIIKGNKAINVYELSKIAEILNTTTDELLTVNLNKNTYNSDHISFMGDIHNNDVSDKFKSICSAIDEIYFLEELLDE